MDELTKPVNSPAGAESGLNDGLEDMDDWTRYRMMWKSGMPLIGMGKQTQSTACLETHLRWLAHNPTVSVPPMAHHLILSESELRQTMRHKTASDNKPTSGHDALQHNHRTMKEVLTERLAEIRGQNRGGEQT